MNTANHLVYNNMGWLGDGSQRAGLPGLNGGGAATAVAPPPQLLTKHTALSHVYHVHVLWKQVWKSTAYLEVAISMPIEYLYSAKSQRSMACEWLDVMGRREKLRFKTEFKSSKTDRWVDTQRERNPIIRWRYTKSSRSRRFSTGRNSKKVDHKLLEGLYRSIRSDK